MDGIPLDLIARAIVPLFIAFVLLNFADATTTLVAVTGDRHFVEFNRFASNLFKMQLPGFLYAYLLKNVPAVPLFYIVFVRGSEKHDAEVRLLKFAAFVILVAADIYLGFIVLGSNIPNLISARVI